MMLPLIFSQISGDDAIDSVSVLVFKILFLVGVLIIASGAWGMRGGQVEIGVIGIIAGMIMALAYPVMSGFYDKLGMGRAKVKLGQIEPALKTLENPPC